METFVSVTFKRSYLQILEVEVSWVLVSGLVSTMTIGNDGVEEILEHHVRLLITGNATDGHDEGVT